MIFLPRHGRGHHLSPSDIDYRANIHVLKRVGVTDLVSLSACGSFKEELAPGTFVLVDQFLDRTMRRESSCFGRGCVAHVSMAHPVGPRLQQRIALAAEAEGIEVHRGGTYVCMEGPQFSSLAESRAYRAGGYDVIGMTNMPEAKLAREAEITSNEPGRSAGIGARDRVAQDFPPDHEPCPAGPTARSITPS